MSDDDSDIRVLEIGDPGLRAVSAPVGDDFRADNALLQRALDAFRARAGFGRAIAAPQIGIPRRFIALRLPDGPRVVVDPEITWRSPATFTMWDDCMSFPWLFVKLRRHDSISLAYTDERGERRRWDALPRDLAELLQHEIDHLDGVLAVDRAEGRAALVSRAAFAARPDHFAAQVDYVIGATPKQR